MSDPQSIDMRCADGRVLPAKWHASADPVAALLVAPALGVPRRYYDPFATALADAGISTLTFDYRGIGDAQGSNSDDATLTLEDWGRQDIAAALAELRQRATSVPRFYLGHSCGTQLMGLAAGSEGLSGMVFVAASRPNASHWKGAMRIQVETMWRVLIPLLSGRPRFPARQVGFAAVDVPGSVMRQWGQWCRSPRYLFSPGHGIDLSRYRKFKMPALVYDFADDAFAPTKTVDALLSEMPGLAVTRRRVAPADVGLRSIGHSGFFRSSNAHALWKPCIDWVLAAAKQAHAAAA